MDHIFDYFIETTIDSNSVKHKDRKYKETCLQEMPFVRLRRSFSFLKDILSSTSWYSSFQEDP